MCACIQALLCQQITVDLHVCLRSKLKLNSCFQDSHRILAPILLSHPAMHYWKKVNGLQCRRLLNLYFHRHTVIMLFVFSVYFRDKGYSRRNGKQREGCKYVYITANHLMAL